MSKYLHLIDCSSFIHAGAVNKYSYIDGGVVEDFDGYRNRIIPTGGISYIFTRLLSFLNDKQHDFIFACDRNPLIKKQMLPSYKSNRTHARDIEVQKQVAEYILRDCGFNVIACDDYEADDIIFTAVQAYRKMYDHIFIHTGDSDLYFLVRDNVSVIGSNSRAKDVTLENYPYTVKKNEVVPYNSSTFLKILTGDRSDCIPPVNKQLRLQAQAMFLNDKFMPYLGERDYMKTIVSSMLPELSFQLELVFPLSVSMDLFLESNPNFSRVIAWGKKINNAKLKQLVTSEDVTDQIDELFNKGFYLD